MSALPSRRRHAHVSTLAALAAFATALVVAPLTVASATGVHQEAPRPPRSVAALREEVRQTGERLAAAAAAYERGQEQLGALLQLKVSTQRTVEELQREATAAQARVTSFASEIYRNPGSPALNAFLAGDLRSAFDYLHLKQVLDQDSTARQRDLDLLTTRAAYTQELLQGQDDAASAAIKLQSKLDDDLTRLQADAQASRVRLEAAAAELRRQREAAAARALGTGTGGPYCVGPTPEDAINGFLPNSALCPLRTAPGQHLIGPAAAGFDAMSDAFATTFSRSLCITDSYRDYGSQVQVFRAKPGLAATPGRSQHGWGRAVDLCGGAQHFGSPEFRWLTQNAGSFGFVHPDWAEPSGSKPEPWHWEFVG